MRPSEREPDHADACLQAKYSVGGSSAAVSSVVVPAQGSTFVLVATDDATGAVDLQLTAH